MAIANREKVAVLKPTKVGNRNPVVLILLIGIGWGHPGLGGKGEFSYSVCAHLFRIPTLQGKDWARNGVLLDRLQKRRFVISDAIIL
jgi:hypothetical protein